MFDKIKKLQELKKMQEEFKQEKVTVEKQGVAVTINGNFEVEDIKLSTELGTQDQQEILKQCLNEAREKIQKTLAGKMMTLGIGF
jgi:DNA-binding protein YbaB